MLHEGMYGCWIRACVHVGFASVQVSILLLLHLGGINKEEIALEIPTGSENRIHRTQTTPS